METGKTRRAANWAAGFSTGTRLVSILPIFYLYLGQSLLAFWLSPEQVEAATNWQQKWELWENATNTFEHIATIIAILIGGWWTYYTFIKGRTFTQRVEPKVTGKMVYIESTPYLLVIIKLKNPGSTKAEIDQKGTGLRVYSYRVTKAGVTDVGWYDLFEEKLIILLDHYWIEPNETVEEPLLIPITGVHVAFKLRLRVNTPSATSETAAIIEYKSEAASRQEDIKDNRKE